MTVFTYLDTGPITKFSFLDHNMANFEHFANIIDGQLKTTKLTSHGINPSSLEPLAPVPVCERDDVDAAVKAAQRAAARWARTSIEKRQQAVVRYADALASQENDFATMLVREQGKPVRAIVKTSGRLALMAFEVFRSYL